MFLASTPTLKGLSRIEREYELSDQQRYHVPCPHCGGLQWLQFERLRLGEPGKARDGPQYLCEHCDERRSPNGTRRAMMDGGKRCRNGRPTAPPDVHRCGESRVEWSGIHISGLYSPLGWLSWEEIARGWEGALGNDAALKTLKNTILGETWAENAVRRRTGSGSMNAGAEVWQLGAGRSLTRCVAAYRRGRCSARPDRGRCLGLGPQSVFLAGRSRRS